MEVVKALEKDESFQKKLSSMTEEEVKVSLFVMKECFPTNVHP